MAKPKLSPPLSLFVCAANNQPSPPLIAKLCGLIADALRSAAAAVSTNLSLMCWRIGQSVMPEVLRDEHAAIGETLVQVVARQLTATYGRGFAEKNLCRMEQFSQVYADKTIVVLRIRQLTWRICGGFCH